MMLTLPEIVAACGYITGVDSLGLRKSGTGYLIAPNLVATCAHVVDEVDLKTIEIRFDGATKLAKCIRSNPDKNIDCAVIELTEPLKDVAPLRLGGTCEWKATWDTYGFPAAAKGAGIVLSGIVSNPNARDDRQAEVLDLFSPEVAAGMATPLHGFSGSPVIVDGFVVGHLKRFLSDPSEATRPAFGKVYATRSSCVNGLLHIVTDIPEPVPMIPPLLGTPAYATQLQKVRNLIKKWEDEDLPQGRAGLLAAESLIQLGEPVEAMGILDNVPQTVRKDQLFALALAKTSEPSNIEKAVQILENLKATGNWDAETGGLLGGRFKQRWRKSGNNDDLKKSHNLYLSTFESTGDPYPGINAAATALWLGDKSRSEKIAGKILEVLDTKPLGSMNHWDFATKGEALMLSGKVEDATKWYRNASQLCDYAPEDIKTMSDQVTKNLESLGMDESIFDEVFKQK